MRDLFAGDLKTCGWWGWVEVGCYRIETTLQIGSVYIWYSIDKFRGELTKISRITVKTEKRKMWRTAIATGGPRHP